jgi:hypothetical protein
MGGNDIKKWAFFIDTFRDSVAVILQEELGAKGGRRNEHVEADTRIRLGVQVN